MTLAAALFLQGILVAIVGAGLYIVGGFMPRFSWVAICNALGTVSVIAALTLVSASLWVGVE